MSILPSADFFCAQPYGDSKSFAAGLDHNAAMGGGHCPDAPLFHASQTKQRARVSNSVTSMPQLGKRSRCLRSHEQGYFFWLDRVAHAQHSDTFYAWGACPGPEGLVTAQGWSPKLDWPILGALRFGRAPDVACVQTALPRRRPTVHNGLFLLREWWAFCVFEALCTFWSRTLIFKISVFCYLSTTAVEFLC